MSSRKQLHLTLFTIAKPFAGHAGIIQANALKSWQELEPSPDILVFGDDQSTERFCKARDLAFLPCLELNEHDTPLLSHVFRDASSVAQTNYLCFVNSDIVLTQSFLNAVARVVKQRPNALVAGRRIDFEQPHPIDFSDRRWEEKVNERAGRGGILNPLHGSDFFVFASAAAPKMRNFAVGRPYWDNWMIGDFIGRGLPVVDLSPSIRVFHQDHGYEHVAYRRGPRWKGPEGDRNREILLSDQGSFYNLLDATHVFVRGHVIPNPGPRRWSRKARRSLGKLRAFFRPEAQVSIPSRRARGRASPYGPKLQDLRKAL